MKSFYRFNAEYIKRDIFVKKRDIHLVIMGGFSGGGGMGGGRGRGPLLSRMFQKFFEGNHLSGGIVKSSQGRSYVVGMERGCTLAKFFFAPLFLHFFLYPPRVIFKIFRLYFQYFIASFFIFK